MNINPQKKQYSIVLIGEFNPAMFQPEWFLRNNIISKEDADFARSTTGSTPLVVTPQITLFGTPQLKIKVEMKRFEIIADKEPYISAKDFIYNTFSALPGYTISAYGFNYSAHYGVENNEIYQRIGDNLAPKQYWESLLGDDMTGLERKGGLATIQMQKEKNDNKGRLTVILQPSAIIKPGVFITSNDHTTVSSDDMMAETVLDEINRRFEKSFEEMKVIQEDLIKRAVENCE